MPNTNRNKLEQGRAEFAYTCAIAGAKLTKSKEYRSYVKKFPMYIKTNGLGAALSFAFAKGCKNGVPEESKAWGLLYRHIELWLKEDDKNLILFEENQLVDQLMKVDSSQYRAITVEVLAFLTWLRRFVEGLIESDNNETSNN